MARLLGPTVLALSLVAAITSRVDATCAVLPRVAKVLFADAKVPEGGGILVSLVYERGPEPDYRHMRIVDPSWRFRVGATLHVPVAETLAPGLAIYRLPSGVTSAELVDGKEVLGRLEVTTTKTPPLSAPRLKALRQESHGSRKGSTIAMWADLAGAAPEGAIALVVSDGKVARSFGFVPADAKNRTIQVYDHAPCVVDPDGTVMSGNGEKLELYWIDRAGRRSPSTKLTLVAKGSPLE
jgi:hypothetical protein